MRYRHPFEWITDSGQTRAYVPLLIATLLLVVAMQTTGAPLKTAAAPMGIVSFEYAMNLTVARLMIQSWGAQGQLYAGLNMGLDFLFLFAYAISIGLGCVLLARRLSGGAGFAYSLGVTLAWGLVLAAALDFTEDVALVQVLLGTQNELWPALAAWCASPKFLLIVLGLLYLIIGSVVALLRRWRA